MLKRMKKNYWKNDIILILKSINSYKKTNKDHTIMYISTPIKLTERTIMFFNRINKKIVLVEETDTICSYNINIL